MQGEEDEPNKPNNTLLRLALSEWIETHHADMLTALLPFANLLSSTLGLTRIEIASELLVEVTRRVLENPDNYNPIRPPQAWLLGIARNVLLEWKDREIKWKLRYKNMHSVTSAADSEQEDPIRQLISSAQVDTQVEAIGNIWAENMLHQAPKPHQEIINAYMATDFDTDETAIMLGITNINVRQRLFRARKWFKSRLHLTHGILSHGGRQ